MTTSYTTTPPTVNPILTAPLRALLDLLRDLSARHGYSWARNEWLAQRLKCTPRTITRQIAALIHAGYITARRVANERHIQPAANPPETPRPKRVKYTLRNPDTPAEMSTRCLPPSRECKSRGNTIPPETSEATEQPLVADLQAQGVCPTVAKRLAASNPDECRIQIEAVKTRKGIRDIPAYLVAAIQGAYKHTQKQQDAPTARIKRFAVSNPRPAENPQKDAEAAYEALSEREKQQIEEQIISKLSAIARRSRYIIRAACISYLTTTATAAPRPSDTTAAAPAFAPPVS